MNRNDFHSLRAARRLFSQAEQDALNTEANRRLMLLAGVLFAAACAVLTLGFFST